MLEVKRDEFCDLKQIKTYELFHINIPINKFYLSNFSFNQYNKIMCNVKCVIGTIKSRQKNV